MRVLLTIYKNLISPLLAALVRGLGLEPQCRFYPTCSEYAAQAIACHGPIGGALLAASRIFRCHPFGAGGVDSVPHSHPQHPIR